MKNIRSSHKNYKELSDNPIDINRYAKIVNAFNKFLVEKLFEGKKITLPERMGTIIIKGKKVKLETDEQGNPLNLAPNYKATNELWAKCPECKKNKQFVYYLNEHTNMVRYRFFWSKNRVLVANKTFYNIVFTRTNKRNLAKLINQGKEFYVEPNNY